MKLDYSTLAGSGRIVEEVLTDREVVEPTEPDTEVEKTEPTAPDTSDEELAKFNTGLIIFIVILVIGAAVAIVLILKRMKQIKNEK